MKVLGVESSCLMVVVVVEMVKHEIAIKARCLRKLKYSCKIQLTRIEQCR